MLLSHKQNSVDVGYKKLNNNQYLNINTGEIKTIDKSLNNKRNINSIHHTFRDLAMLILLNFNGDKSEAFITLTFNTRIVEQDYVKKSIKNFWGRFCRFVGSYKNYRAIFIKEYQQSGRIHLHLLIKYLKGEKLNISESDINTLWGLGFVNYSQLYDVEGLINYLNPFRNLKKRKRLHFYKPYEKVFICRGSIERLCKIKTTYGSALKLAETNKLKKYSNDSYAVLDQDGVPLNIINKIIYKEDV